MSFSDWLFPNNTKPALDPKIRYGKDFKNSLGKHYLILSEKPRVVIPEKFRYEHSIIMGASGKGKTDLLQNMYAQDILNGAGVIFVDPKNDQFNMMLRLATLAKRIQRSDGSKKPQFHSFRPTCKKSETWNPLYGKDPIQIANRLLTALYPEDMQTNDFYKDVAANMLRNLITLLMAMGTINLNDLYIAITYEEVLKKLVRILDGNEKYRNEIREIKMDYLEGKKETAEKFKMGLRVKLQPLVKAPWSMLLNDYEPNIVVQDIINNGDILHFGLASDLLGKESYQPLMRLFLAEVKQAAGNRYQERNAKPCFFYCDEYGDVASNDFIEGIKKYRSAGIGFLIGFQDLGDLTRLGESFKIQTITNCATKFFFNTPEPESADYIAKLFGTYESDRVSAQSRNTQGDIRGQSERLNDKAFKIEPDYLKNMDRGQCVALMPFMHKKEYAIFRFKSPLIKIEHLPYGDNMSYDSLTYKINFLPGDGLDLEYRFFGNGVLRDEPKVFIDDKPASELQRARQINFKLSVKDEEAPKRKDYPKENK